MFATYLPKGYAGPVAWIDRGVELGKAALITLWLPQVLKGGYPLRVEYAEASGEKSGKEPHLRVIVEASVGIYRGDEASPISRPTFGIQLDELEDTSVGKWELRALRAPLFAEDLRGTV